MVNITVFGVGKLGLCFSLQCEKRGYNVLGVDVVESYVHNLNKKTFFSDEPGVNEALVSSLQFKVTMSIDDGIAHSNYLFIFLPTPTGTGEKSYDHSLLSGLLQQFNDRRIRSKHIIICCTVLPGYGKIAKSLVSNCEACTVSYNPEFIAQGAILQGLSHPDIVLIGEGDSEAGQFLEDFYANFCENQPTVHRVSLESAEIAKIALNCFLTTKIAFANMVGDIANNTPGANAQEILHAIGSDSRIGPKYLNFGYGYGGPCFPRDNRALGHYAAAIGIEPLIPRATDKSNQKHAEVMVESFLKEDKPENVCYKEDCSVVIIEESQKLAVAKSLAMRGRKVIIKDALPVIRVVQAEFGDLFTYEIVHYLKELRS